MQSTRFRSSDLQGKADLYSESGVAEYWVVDIPNQRIHVMTRIERGRYRSIVIHTPPSRLSPQCYPSASLPLADLFNID